MTFQITHTFIFNEVKWQFSVIFVLNSDVESELHLKMIFVTITKEIQKHINVGALKAAIKFVKEKNNNSYLNMRNYLAGNLSVHLC